MYLLEKIRIFMTGSLFYDRINKKIWKIKEYKTETRISFSGKNISVKVTKGKLLWTKQKEKQKYFFKSWG